jgi:transcriptional regulator with XRE-family HTH domain
MDENNGKMSQIIKSIRETKGYSQHYVATKLHISQQAYSAIENKPENASLIRLMDLSKVLSVELSDIIGITNKYVLQNIGQHGGNSATKMVNNYTAQEHNELYERIISELKEEIAYLRTLKR